MVSWVRLRRALSYSIAGYAGFSSPNPAHRRSARRSSRLRYRRCRSFEGAAVLHSAAGTEIVAPPPFAGRARFGSPVWASPSYRGPGRRSNVVFRPSCLMFYVFAPRDSERRRYYRTMITVFYNNSICKIRPFDGVVEGMPPKKVAIRRRTVWPHVVASALVGGALPRRG